MARHASNRERMQRLALEAELTAAEKAEKKAAPKKATTRRKSAVTAAGRPGLKLVWKILDPESREKAAFPFPKKDAAEARARELQEKSGRAHRVVGVKVPLDEAI